MYNYLTTKRVFTKRRAGMKKYETLSRLREAKIIAVVRASGAEQAVDAVGALLKGGIYAIELAFTRCIS